MAADDRDREEPETQAERDAAPSVDELVRLLESLVDDPEAVRRRNFSDSRCLFLRDSFRQQPMLPYRLDRASSVPSSYFV